MRAEAPVKRKEVWCVWRGEHVGSCSKKIKSETTSEWSRIRRLRSAVRIHRLRRSRKRKNSYLTLPVSMRGGDTTDSQQ